MRKGLLILLLNLIFPFLAFAGSTQLSEPIDIPSTGWNKVLQVSNGNTLLFHFEPRKAIVVKLFDKDRKEIASTRFLGKIIDNNALERSEIHGIYEIGGQAVIFISQAVLNSETLVRICFDINTGKLIEEQKIISSKSYKQNYEFSLVRNSLAGGYAVFCMLDLETNFKDFPHMEIFDEKHNQVRSVKLDLQAKDYDYINHINTCMGNDGSIVVMMNLSKIINYPNDIQFSLVVAYYGVGDSVFHPVVTPLPKLVGPYYGMYTHNDFSKMINIFLVSATSYLRKFGLQTSTEIAFHNFMLRYPLEDARGMTYSNIENRLANNKLMEVTNSLSYINPVPIRSYTNKFGMTILISEDNKQNVKFKTGNTVSTFLGDIVVTHMADDGKETWSTIIPKRQFLDYRILPRAIHQRGQYRQLFRISDPVPDWHQQFVSFQSFVTPKGNCYIIYNDLKSNFNKKFGDNIDSIATYTQNGITKTDAVCYIISRKKEESKHYLIEPTAETNYSTLVESIDYLETSSTLAGVFVENSEKNQTIRLGWKQLDD